MADLRDACQVEELLSAYLDGELRPGELQAVVEHVETCLDCIAEFRNLKEARTAVRLLPTLQVPDNLIPFAHYGEDLSAYLDGELNTQEQRIIGSHVVTCEDCRRELQDLDLARTAVRALPGVELPELNWNHEDHLAARRRTRTRRVVAGGVSAAAVAALVLGLAAGRDESTPIDLDTIADRHIARASLEAGFSVIPTGFSSRVEP
ncbi:MAG TPA: zf-HC2 domain-containing protein [Acidimicrobiia bacterium]|jgi:anti-sigma factor RsiW